MPKKQPPEKKGRKFIQSKNYILTIPFKHFKSDAMDVKKINYFIGCEEIGLNTEFHHMQCFINLKERCNTIKTLNSILGLPLENDKLVFHAEAKSNLSTFQDCYNYVMKPESKPVDRDFYKFEIGTLPQETNKKNVVSNANDLALLLIDDIKKGMSFNDLILNHLSYFNRHLNQFKELYKRFKPVKKFNIKIDVSLNEWQTNLFNDIDNQIKEKDDRTINLIVDVGGGAGKTTTSKLLNDISVDNNMICQRIDTSKKADIAFALHDDVKIVNFDLSRAQEDYINWDAIESVKNGAVFSSKYESTEKILNNNPIVNVFCNSLPKDLPNLLSLDRCNIMIINKKGKIFEKIAFFNDDHELNDQLYYKLYDENKFSKPIKKQQNSNFLD